MIRSDKLPGVSGKILQDKLSLCAVYRLLHLCFYPLTCDMLALLHDNNPGQSKPFLHFQGLCSFRYSCTPVWLCAFFSPLQPVQLEQLNLSASCSKPLRHIVLALRRSLNSPCTVSTTCTIPTIRTIFAVSAVARRGAICFAVKRPVWALKRYASDDPRRYVNSIR